MHEPSRERDPRPDAAPDPGLLPRVGDVLAGFRLIGELGEGAFGRVFLAQQGDLADRPVALKVSFEPSGEPRTLARLQHTNIVPVYSVHRAGALQAVCMPYFGSTTLRDVLEDLRGQRALPASGRGLVSTLYDRRQGARSRALASTLAAAAGAPAANPGGPPSASASARDGLAAPAEEPRVEALRLLENLPYVQAVLWLAARLVGGLAHAHERGVLHRDLKPANVLLTDEGQPMLLDFNLAADARARGAVAAAVGGTLGYMAPEHLEAYRGSPRAVDARSDLYSVGVILFELLTGRAPFPVPDGPASALIDGLIRDRLGPPPRLRPHNGAVTPAVEAIVRRLLEPDPDRRYRSAAELREDLERQLADRPLKFAPDPSPRERLRKWARRHPTLCGASTLTGAAVLLVGLLGGAGWYVAEGTLDDLARGRRAAFREAFEQSQILLQARGLAPDGLGRGVDQARRALASYGVDGPGDWTDSPAVARLAAADRRALREEVAELILLEARAAVALAERGGDPPARERALRRAVARLDRAECLDPSRPAALYQDRARYQEALGRADLAARDRARAAERPATTARDLDLLGTSRLAAGDPDGAEAALARAVALAPRRFWAWFTLGLCHADQGRPEAAAYDFSVCTVLAEDLAWPHLNRGLALARAGHLRAARAAYDRALQLDPTLVEALVDRALADLELDAPEPALRDLDRAIALGAGTPAVRLARAEAIARLGRSAEAEPAFDALIAEHPDDPAPLVARGFARLETDPRGAATDFDAALELDPNQARAHLGRACLLRRDDPRHALEAAQRALDADPNLGDALQLRALARARLGDRAAEADVERLLLAPTPRRLYNAACCLALLARTGPDADTEPGRVADAIALLRRARGAGLPPTPLRDDPDLDALRADPAFLALLAPAPAR